MQSKFENATGNERNFYLKKTRKGKGKLLENLCSLNRKLFLHLFSCQTTGRKLGLLLSNSNLHLYRGRIFFLASMRYFSSKALLRDNGIRYGRTKEEKMKVVSKGDNGLRPPLRTAHSHQAKPQAQTRSDGATESNSYVFVFQKEYHS